MSALKFRSYAIPLTVVLVCFLTLAATLSEPAYGKGPARSPGGSSDNRLEDSPPPPDMRGDAPSLTIPTNPSAEGGRSSLWDIFFSGSERRSDSVGISSGLYRNDYADIGRLWKERQERRDSPSGYTRWGYYRSGRPYFPYPPPCRYTYYHYDYLPGYVFPSVYCFYTGLVPPYVLGCRTFSIKCGNFRLSYTDLPSTILLCASRIDYSLCSTDRHYHTLSLALRDIARAWESGDADIIQRYVRRNSRIAIFLKGEYAYSVDRDDYYEMTLDAMKAIKTSSFEFYRLRQRGPLEVVAYGKHVYYDDWYYYCPRKTIYVRYTFERQGDDWYITEVGTSPYEVYW